MVVADGDGAPAGGFPSGAYATYKRATSYFLDWLVRVRNSGAVDVAVAVESASASGEQHRLEVYDRIVEAIARAPGALPASITKHWPLAIEACESAIALREHVARFYAPSQSYVKHEHFISRMRAWLEALRGAAQSDEPSRTHDGTRSLDFSNYFDVLDLPDDYFPSVETPVAVASSSAGKTPSTGNKSREPTGDGLVDFMYEDGVEWELAYLFMELDELSAAVYGAFLDVKREKKTLVEAGVVTKVAIDIASAAIARMQLRQPSIRSISDLTFYLMDQVYFATTIDRHREILRAWPPSFDEPPTRPRYPRGTIFHDSLRGVKLLESMVESLKSCTDDKIMMDPTFLGDPYDEDETQHYTIPDMADAPEFWKQELPEVINWCRDMRASGAAVDDGSVASCFLAPIDRFFATGRSSIEALFVCICWIRSVAALQGDGGLSRNVSLSIQHRWELQARLATTRALGEPLKQCIRDLFKTMNAFDTKSRALRANPVLASFVLLDNQFEYLRVGTQAMFNSSRLRAFGHVYATMRHMELIEANPMWDNILRTHDRFIFPQSRPAAESSPFLRTYLQNSDETVQTFATRLQESAVVIDRTAKRTRERIEHTDVSRVIRLVKTKDFSTLPGGFIQSSSSKTLLSNISNLSSEELFESRELSVDLLRLACDIEGVFVSMRGILDCDAEIRKIVGWESPDSYKASCALEAAVMLKLFSQLDAVSSNTRATLATAGSGMVSHDLHIQIVSALIQIFGNDHPAQQEKVYFTFRPTPNWVTTEFGKTTRATRIQTGSTTAIFDRVFKMMESSRAALSERQLHDLKRTIIEHPGILAIKSATTKSRLCTILHQAAAGRAHDFRLVEWLIQMGALLCQPRLGKSNGCQELAVHSAARGGHVNTVRLLLEAGKLRDLHEVTADTKESLVYIAARNGDLTLLAVLVGLGAIPTGQDATGQYMVDTVTSRRIYTDGTHERETAQTKTSERTVRNRRRKKRAQSRVAELEASTLDATGDTDRIGQLTECLNKLKKTSQMLPEEREACIMSALAILDAIPSVGPQHIHVDIDPISTKAEIVREATEASQALFLLNKFHRQLPQSASKVPRHEYWSDEVHESSLSNWEKLLNWTGSSLSLVRFINFAVYIARLFIVVNRTAQAKEVLELAERRLVKCKYRSTHFRELVQRVVALRKRAGMVPAIASTPDGLRRFDWYTAKYRDGFTAREILDRMYGYGFYCTLELSSTEHDFEIEMALDSLPPETNAVMSGGIVNLAAETAGHLASSIALVEDVAKEHGFHFTNEPVHAKSFTVLGFEFSETQIVRVGLAGTS